MSSPVRDAFYTGQSVGPAAYAEGPSRDHDDENSSRSNVGSGGDAPTHVWDGDVGDIGPEVPDLESALFGPPAARQPAPEVDISNMGGAEMGQDGPIVIDPITTFSNAGLHPAMERNISLAQYLLPTPIQQYCIPAISSGHDLIAIAQTGSGKTAAYLIPILNKLMGKAKKLAAPRPNPATYKPGRDPRVRGEPLVCILAPTRELAFQIFTEALKFCYRSMLRPCVLYGGGPMQVQKDHLMKGCDVLVACPGRLGEFLDLPSYLDFGRLQYMVIDEADAMLLDEWRTDLHRILGAVHDNGHVQYLFFSATFPRPLRDLASAYLAKQHVRLYMGRAGRANANIVQMVIQTHPTMKRKALVDLLEAYGAQRTMIFVNNKRTADDLEDHLHQENLPCTTLHSDRPQLEREDALRSFRNGHVPILIATGVSARGIDVLDVAHVINFDLPRIQHGGIEEYTHRIGRTGRIGKRGLATSFFTRADEPLAPVLVRTLLETDQTVPDFLQCFMPDGDELTNLQFPSEQEADTEGQHAGPAVGDDWEAPAGGDDADDAWGVPAGGDNDDDAWGVPPAGDDADDAWGAPPAGDNADDAWGVPPAGDNADDAWGVPPAGDDADDAWGTPPGGYDAGNAWGNGAAFGDDAGGAIADALAGLALTGGDAAGEKRDDTVGGAADKLGGSGGYAAGKKPGDAGVGSGGESGGPLGGYKDIIAAGTDATSSAGSGY